jgi:hypothetical protein
VAKLKKGFNYFEEQQQSSSKTKAALLCYRYDKVCNNSPTEEFKRRSD